jgi:hypothetical protein
MMCFQPRKRLPGKSPEQALIAECLDALEPVTSENISHDLVLCRSNNEVEVEAALTLKLCVEEDLELLLVWMMASVLQSVWKPRLEKSRVQHTCIKPLLASRCRFFQNRLQVYFTLNR